MVGSTLAGSKGCATALAILFLGLFSMLAEQRAYAGDFIVYSPHVAQGRTEFEFRGFGYHDDNGDLNGTRGYNFSASYGVTAWWKPEIYFANFEREPGSSTKFSGYEFENTFQLAPNGRFWADPGFLLSYEHPKAAGEPDVLEFGPLLEKSSGRIDQRLNLIWEKQIGAGAGDQYEFRSAYSVNYRVTTGFRPGVEAYYRPDDHARQLGPVISGEIYSATGREFAYRLGVVFGLNDTAPDETLIAQLEYAF